MLLRITCLISLFLLASCATSPNKESAIGKSILQNTKSIDGSKKYSMMFDKLNGSKLKVGPFTTPNKAFHVINPGKHEIEMHVTYSGDKVRGVKAASFKTTITLEPNETYTMKASEKGGCLAMTLLDSKESVLYGPAFKPHYNYMSGEYLYTILVGPVKGGLKCDS